MASIVATCKLNSVNPAAYIAETLEAIIDGHPHSLDHASPRAIGDGPNGHWRRPHLLQTSPAKSRLHLLWATARSGPSTSWPMSSKFSSPYCARATR
nr:transposase domain-containing protein [Bradyrhizobium sp. CW7]